MATRKVLSTFVCVIFLFAVSYGQNFGQDGNFVQGNGQPFAGNGSPIPTANNGNAFQPTNPQPPTNNIGQPNFGNQGNFGQQGNTGIPQPNNNVPVNNFNQPGNVQPTNTFAGPQPNFGQQNFGPQQGQQPNFGIGPVPQQPNFGQPPQNNFGQPQFGQQGQQPNFGQPQNNIGQPNLIAPTNIGQQGPLNAFTPQSGLGQGLLQNNNGGFGGNFLGSIPFVGGFSAFNQFGNPFLNGGEPQNNGFGGGLFNGFGGLQTQNFGNNFGGMFLCYTHIYVYVILFTCKCQFKGV